MRNTKQKELIFNIIKNSHNHLTAKEVYEIARKEILNISLGTVYRNLNELVINEQIIQLKTKSGTDHYDYIPNKRHAHFICDMCGKIVDIFNINFSYNSKELENYDIKDVDIIITGLCNDCQKKGK